MKPRVILFFVIFVLICSLSYVFAGVPQMINYQGKLTDSSGALITDTVSIVFTMYDDSSDGTALWTETQDSVIARNGVFSVLLGGVNEIPDSVFTGAARYLGIKVGLDSEMTPRKAIVSVGYAYRSEYADTADYAQVAVSDGDWIIDGDNIYFDRDYVGIGTSPGPYSRLKVATFPGTTNLEGINIEIAPGSATSDINFGLNVDATSPYVTGTQNAGGLLRVVANGVQDDLALMQLKYDDGGGGYTALYVRGDGNVGMGTATPENQLDIVGWGPTVRVLATASNATAIIEALGAGGVQWQWQTGNNWSTMNGRIRLLAGPHEWLTILPGGNVGIGTANPENRLHVTGAINLDPTTAPANPSTGFVIYVDTSDGKLKAKSYLGNVTILANP